MSTGEPVDPFVKARAEEYAEGLIAARTLNQFEANSVAAETAFTALLWARRVDCGCCSCTQLPADKTLRDLVHKADKIIKADKDGPGIPLTVDSYELPEEERGY